MTHRLGFISAEPQRNYPAASTAKTLLATIDSVDRLPYPQIRGAGRSVD